MWKRTKKVKGTPKASPKNEELKLEKPKKVKQQKISIQEVFSLYSPLELVILAAILFGASFYYFNLLLRDTQLSLGFSVVTGLYLFLVFSLQNRKLKRYQDNLNNLLKYVNNVTFSLRSGDGVLRSLETSVQSVNEDVRKDLEKTIEIMRKDTVLDATHFEKYNFPALNQFHQNLAIRYDHGGDAKELFDVIQKRMVAEMQKRDELYRRKKGLKTNILVLMGMVFATTVIMAVMTPDLWTAFLKHQAASMTIIGGYTGLGMVLMYFVQKKAIDISVRL